MFAAAPLLAFALAAAPSVNAFFRVACSGSTLVRERADPIISPGVASGHLHVIHGGNAFGLNHTYEKARTSTCTSCEVTSDLSNYWTPGLYFHDKKAGTFELVKNGGLLAYYQQRGDGKANITAFPPGLRMISGDMKRRSKKFEEGEGSQAELAERATKLTCLRYTNGQSGYDLYGFPTTRCEAGFNARLHMPACWDGKNVDSADHKSHVAYMSILDNGKCPETHPVQLPSLFFEVTFDTGDFDDRWNPDAGDEWPFVLSSGDTTGHGWHGDFLNGWDVPVLQKALELCDNQTPGTAGGNARECPYLQMQSADDAHKCTKEPEVVEEIQGPFTRLPGCNPLQSGPEDATAYTMANCPLDGAAPVPEPTDSAPVDEPTTSATDVPSTTSDVPEPTSTPEEPTSTTDVPEEPTVTDSTTQPEAPTQSVVTVTATVTTTVTAAPECSSTASFRRPIHHRRSVVPDNFIAGRAPEKFQPRRR